MFIDKFTLAIIATAVSACLFPLPHQALAFVGYFSSVGISCLFFFYGARLSRQAIVEGAMQWKLHALIVLCTFVFFPILGLIIRPFIQNIFTPELILGIIFICLLPSTIQSSIALTSIAGGNVAAAICAASLSSLLGIFITPLLLASFTHVKRDFYQSIDSIISIIIQLCIHFIVGHLMQQKLSHWITRNRSLLRFLDQGIILIIIYKAFSEAIHGNLWKNIPLTTLVSIFLVVLGIFAIAFTSILWLARFLKLTRADAITLVFCGSKKSLATGVTIANVMFPSNLLSVIVLPLMFYHQIQLLVCTFFAQKYALDEKKSEIVRKV